MLLYAQDMSIWCHHGSHACSQIARTCMSSQTDGATPTCGKSGEGMRQHQLQIYCTPTTADQRHTTADVEGRCSRPKVILKELKSSSMPAIEQNRSIRRTG